MTQRGGGRTLWAALFAFCKWRARRSLDLADRWHARAAKCKARSNQSTQFKPEKRNV